MMLSNLLEIILWMALCTGAIALASVGIERRWVDRRNLIRQKINGTTLYLATRRVRLCATRVFISIIGWIYGLDALLVYDHVYSGSTVSFILSMTIFGAFVVIMVEELRTEIIFIDKQIKSRLRHNADNPTI